MHPDPSHTGRPRVLCVDDEPFVLEALRDNLRGSFSIVTASSGAQGLVELAAGEPFAAVVADMRMPEMNGVTFLTAVREQSPESVRLLLTGQADLEDAIAAINDGQIFRFLTKPCPIETVRTALDAAAELHRLVTAERILLEETLHGSVKALTGLLAITHPAAFGRGQRLKQHVTDLAAAIDLADPWQVEIAAMLSQIGCAILPPETAEKYYFGRTLSKSELALVERLPLVAERVIRDIPRLEAICAILAGQNRPPGAAGENETPVGARMLKIAHDFDLLESQSVPADIALDTMRGRKDLYDTDLLTTFAGLRGAAATVQIKEMALAKVELGMVFAADVLTQPGTLLIARGHEVTSSLLERIRNLPDGYTREPIRVIVAGPAAPVELAA
jgi:response regulator RpfG family c-di-GMP phosphodiesterase